MCKMAKSKTPQFKTPQIKTPQMCEMSKKNPANLQKTPQIGRKPETPQRWVPSLIGSKREKMFGQT